MHTSYESLDPLGVGSSFLHIGVNHNRYQYAKRPLLISLSSTISLICILLFVALLIVDKKGCSWSVTLCPLGQTGFHHACHDWKWEFGRSGPIPCAVWGAYTGHIETNTLHHILPRPSNSLVEGDPCGRRNYTILSIPWVEEWRHETPTVLNHSKVLLVPAA